MTRVPLLPLSLLLAANAGATTLELEHAALARLLAVHAMTDGGRLYLDGDAESECRYAFVQEPAVDSEGGRLRIAFVFSGRQAAGVAGRCVGPGGTFDVRLSGVPRFAAGAVFLDEAHLEALGSGHTFFEVIAPLLEQGLKDRLRLPLDVVLGHAAAAVSTAWGVQLGFRDVKVAEIEVLEGSTRLRLEGDARLR
jgi:hypothetical protein